MKTMKERISDINQTAQVDFSRAEGMLDMLNDICGTKFGFLAKRVVIFDYPDASTAKKYAYCRDAWCNL